MTYTTLRELQEIGRKLPSSHDGMVSILFSVIYSTYLLSKMQLNDLDILGAVEDAIGKKTLQQDANASEKNSEDERYQQNDADQCKQRHD